MSFSESEVNQLLKLLVPFLHVLQAQHLHRASAFGLAADQLIDLPEAAGIHQNHLAGRQGGRLESKGQCCSLSHST